MEIKIGQVWKENDDRVRRTLEVLGFEKGRVKIRCLESKRISLASAVRFNEKYGGYSLVEDKPNG